MRTSLGDRLATHGGHGDGLRIVLARQRMTPLRRVVGTLVLLAVIGIVTGQLLGHVAAAGIEQLLELVAVDQTG